MRNLLILDCWKVTEPVKDSQRNWSGKTDASFCERKKYQEELPFSCAAGSSCHSISQFGWLYFVWVIFTNVRGPTDLVVVKLKGKDLRPIGNNERIHQIEARGLRKLRHPSRSRMLHPFFEGSLARQARADAIKQTRYLTDCLEWACPGLIPGIV